MSVDPIHPTIHLAGELDEDWMVLHLGATGYHQMVTNVLLRNDEQIVVQVTDGATHGWPLDFRVHAMTPDEVRAGRTPEELDVMPEEPVE